MVDWNGLFKWSMEHQDGTKPTEFKVMSAEDRKWLEEAMKQYTFNDVDRLKEVATEVKEHMSMPKGKLVDLLDELLELVELHVRNALNLCMSGGMQTLLDIVFSNPHEEARIAACAVFSFANQNNVDVQKLTEKMGALNLAHQYVRETGVKAREAVISAISSLLRGINTDGKRMFLKEYGGIEFLKGAIVDGAEHLRLSKKLVLLLFDFVYNDALVLHEGNPAFIRHSLCTDPAFLQTLLSFVTPATTHLLDYQAHDLRLCVL
jgi:hypothetical protein